LRPIYPFSIAAARAGRDTVHKGKRAELAQTARLRPQHPINLRRVIGSIIGLIHMKISNALFQN
jgi:hypothetical protein